MVFGGISISGAWVPFLGMLTTPIAAIGFVLGGLGVLLAMLRGFKSMGVPLVGTGLCAASIWLALSMTKSASDVMAESVRRIEQAQAEAQRNETARKAERGRAAQDYIANNVDLYDVEARFFDSLLDGRIPGVTFKLKNRGDRTLESVRVCVQFEDVNGKVISEETFQPISRHSFQANSRPLKAGFVWQIEAGSLFAAKSVPSEWVEGRVTAKVVDVEFVADGAAAPPR